MMFCHSSASNCHTLMKILREYETLSGQRINIAKSSITFSKKTPPEIKTAAKNILGISKEGRVGKYLGLSEHFGRRKRDLFTSIVDRIRQCAASWSTRFLSKAGKLTMLHSVLTAIPSFTMTCFELPVSFCKRIQSALTRFWWDDSEDKKGMCWVSWDNLTKPKVMGGIGMRDIQRFNQALLAKLAWRITTVPNCLLARVLKGKYCHKKNFLEVELPSSCSHGWRSVLHGRNLLREHLGKAIGNGQSTRVWKDSWISLDTDIKPFGPVHIDALDLRVSDLLTDDLKWNTQRFNAFLPQLSEQIHLLRPSSLGTEDIFVWQPLQSGIYTTKSGYRVSLQAPRVPPSLPNSITNASEFSWVKDIWNSQCSPKLRVFL